MGKIAFVFAGQGAQSVGMGMDLYARSAAAKRLFDMAETKRDGILRLIQNGPKETLAVTENTQPALFLADLACAAALSEQGVAAEGAAGFSLGEIPAVCYAGIMGDEQAFDFVCRRAEFMQKCAERRGGAMFAVLKLSAPTVENICAALTDAYPANYNCPGQTVVACAAETADALQSAVAQAGGKAVKLAVGGAFHSPFMDGARADIAEYLRDLRTPPKIPLYANLTAQIYGDPKEMLSAQVCRPVLWRNTIENMIADGFDTFVECGPGRTLTGLIKKISADARTLNVSDAATLEHAVKELRNA